MHKIQIDNFIFHVNVTEYSPAILGSYSYNADSDVDYYGYPEELEWSCFFIEEFIDCEATMVDEETTIALVDAYAEQITDKLLDIIKFEQECVEEYYV